jgi:long-subunit fatty acid transport protein
VKRTPERVRRLATYARLTVGCLLAGSASAAVSNPNLGSSPIPVGAGPRALGMGGAFSAVADDATAATWNPGGMTQLERPEIGLSVGGYYRRADPDVGDLEDRTDVDLDHVSAILPFHAFGCQQTVGVAWQRQFDFARRLSTASVSDTGIAVITQDVDVDVEGAFSSVSLSYAIEIRPGLSLGATGQVWNDRFTGRSHYQRDMKEVSTTTFVFPPITLDSGVDEHLEVEVDEGYSAVIGLWWQAIPELTVAMVVKPTYRLRLDVERQETLTGNGTTVVGDPEHLSADLHYPTSATLAVAWRHGDRDTIACDATWTQWSHYRVKEGGRTTSPVNAYIPPEDFDDGLAFRLGYEHLVLLDELVLALRVGALYEELPGAAPSPSASEFTDTRAVVDRYYGLTAGTSLCFDHLLYDLGAQVRHGRDVGAGQDAAPEGDADVTTVIVRLGVAYQF